MTDQELTQAQQAVKDILNALGVVRVVYVDDRNNATVSVEDVIAAALVLDTTILATAFAELGEKVPAEQDVLRAKIREVWGTLDPKTQAERGQAVLVAARRHDGKDIDDVADVEILNQLVPQAMLVSLSPTQWEAQNATLLQESRDKRTLFVFDRDFSHANGDPEGGIKIIASLLARTDTQSLICGLLTHTVQPATQPEQWEELSEAHNIPMDRFVVIPKLYLGQAPMLFAQMLKHAALAPDFTDFKRKTKEIIATAAAVAADKIEKVRIHDLDHIVFRISAEEGMWEPEMLFRLHALFHRLEARRLAHDGGNLEALAAKLRAVSGIPTDCEDFPVASSAWGLQRQELYELDGHINKNYLPLELGDIFERVGASGAKKYILLAQPCDLMVRSNGKRAPELRRVPLAEVVEVTGERPKYAEEMPYFDVSPGKRWYAKLKIIYLVCTRILDLCVFNADGVARIVLNGNAPAGIRPAWKARHDILSRQCGRAFKRADLLAPVAGETPTVSQLKQKILKELGGTIFDDDLFKGGVTKADGVTTLTYDCKRVGRVSRARAIGLLMSYTSTLGRPAYDRDFGTLGKTTAPVSAGGTAKVTKPCSC